MRVSNEFGRVFNTFHYINFDFRPGYSRNGTLSFGRVTVMAECASIDFS